MQAKFRVSGLFVVDGEGHASLSMPNFCIGKAFCEYFQTGQLPDTSRKCLPIERPFKGKDAFNVENPKPRNKEGEELLKAVYLAP